MARVPMQSKQLIVLSMLMVQEYASTEQCYSAHVEREIQIGSRLWEGGLEIGARNKVATRVADLRDELRIKADLDKPTADRSGLGRCVECGCR